MLIFWNRQCEKPELKISNERLPRSFYPLVSIFVKQFIFNTFQSEAWNSNKEKGMKRNLLLLMLTLTAASVLAQSKQEVVYLKNGSIVRGTIIEQVPGKNLKLETADGSVFVYDMTDVEKITKEEPKKSQTSSYPGMHPGMDFMIELGPNFSRGGASFSSSIGVGKRISKNFFFGVLGNVSVGSGDPSYMFNLSPRLYVPIGNSKASFVADFRTGVGFSQYDMPTFSKKGTVTGYETKTSCFIPISIMPSISYAVSSKVDLNFGVGYLCSVNTKGGGAGHAGMVRVGLNVHKKNYDAEQKPKPAIRNNGFQMSYEGDFTTGHYDNFNLALVPTYKFNPHFSAGLGFGIGTWSQLRGWEYDNIGLDGTYYIYNNGAINYRIFARGNYRLTDKKLSPFANVDLGVHSRGLEKEEYHEGSWVYNNNEDVRKAAFFLQPSIGLSLRTANNTYLTAMLGYHITSAPRNIPGYSFCGANISIGFTHTFKWGNTKLNQMGEKIKLKKDKTSD